MAEHYLYGNEPAPTNPSRVLLVKILNASSGAGGLSQGTGAPSAAPTNPTVTNAYVDLSTGIVYWWNTTTQSWF